MALSLIAALGLFALGVFEFTTTLIRSSDAYKIAVQKAEQSPLVWSKIGHPFQIGMLIEGNISLNNDSGEAELSIPISGDLGSGHILSERDEKARKVDV